MKEVLQLPRFAVLVKVYRPPNVRNVQSVTFGTTVHSGNRTGGEGALSLENS